MDGIKAKKGDCISITASKPVFLSVTVYNSSGKNMKLILEKKNLVLMERKQKTFLFYQRNKTSK